MANRPNKVESASSLHYNPSNSPSQDAGLVSKDGYERISSLTLYTPENINIDRLLQENPPEMDLKRDCLVYIIHLVTAIPSRKRDILDEIDGFTPINRKLLQKRIHGYKKHIEYLKKIEVLIERNIYCPGKYSMGLKISNRYESRLVPVEITSWTLIKNIVYLNKTYNTETTDELFFLNNWFNDKIEVNYDNGVKFLNKLYMEELFQPEINDERLRYNCRLLPLLKLKNKEFSFYVDNTGNRLHTNFTQIMSPLRKFIKYDGKGLCAVDIKNSQLYLSIALLDDEIFNTNNISDLITNPQLLSNPNYPIMVVEKIKEIKNEPDVILFKKHASEGKFYNYFGEKLVENELIENMPEAELRALAKEITFSSIYSSNQAIGFKREIRLFKQLFPNVYKIYSLIKKGRNNHPALSICLQKLEAKLVLHKACKIIATIRPSIPIFTLHDSIITTEDNVEFVEKVLCNVLKIKIGVKPPLKLERWE